MHCEVISEQYCSEVETSSGFVSSKINHQNLLPTACARMIHDGNECTVRILLDSGSQETFVRKSLSDTLSIKSQAHPVTMKINVLGGKTQHKKVNRVSFQLAPINSTGLNDAVDIDAWTVPNVCVPLEGVHLDKRQCSHLKNLELADNIPRKTATVDLLVGADQYYKLVEGTIKRGKPGSLIAAKTKLGWVLSGPVPGSTCISNSDKNGRSSN